MEKSLAKVKSFDELMFPLTKGQRDYIYLRMMGLEESEALQLIKRKAKAHSVWLSDKAFRELEEHVISNRSLYTEEAFRGFVRDLGLKAQQVLDGLIEKGLEWDELKQGDKPYVMKAVELIAKLAPSGKASEGYEEMLLRIRRKG